MTGPDPLPGRFGRFRVLAEIGRGAMGVVYRAEDPALGREVAIKTVALTGEEAERSQYEARFLQEARAAGRLAHPGIVTVYDVGREGDTAFLAMELLDGRELRDLIREGRVPPPLAVEMAAQVAEALAFAHEHGVIHRDVKPGNVMVLPDGRVKIMDFGIARLADPGVKTATGLLLGSPRYMAPEQITGKPFDRRADVFSLGIVLYEMLTGSAPFEGRDLTQLMFQMVNTPVTPPGHLVAGVPPVLDFVVARALRKQPDERYAGAAEFAADLRAVLPEVIAAEEAVAAQGAPAPAPAGDPSAPTVALALPAQPPDAGDEDASMRPSPRFDNAAGLLRLAVLPRDAEATRTLPGLDGPRPAPRRHRALDLPLAAVVAGYVAATLVAAYLLLG